MRRTITITETADRLRPGDLIQNPDGKWMFIADITDASAAGIPGRYAILLLDPATAVDHGARLMLINPGHVLEFRHGAGRSMRPYAAMERTQVRPAGISGFEVLNTITGEWVYVTSGTWRENFGAGTNREADERSLNMLCRATPADDPEVERIVNALRASRYQSTAEHVLCAEPKAVDRAVELGLVQVVQVRSTTYNRKGERMLAAA
ncbi:hypothetical protein ACIODS_12025 [Micromonospora chalcea]|uniref:hypothetical protein n=1 Tax=Micromonospora chalcea TaxID=1874 RepID=UPI003810DA9E